MTIVKRALASIGKKCFVDYYSEFKNCKDKYKLAEKLLLDNSNAVSSAAQMTRVNYARWIFDNNKEKEALSIIIESKRLDDNTKSKAKELYNNL